MHLASSPVPPFPTCMTSSESPASLHLSTLIWEVDQVVSLALRKREWLMTPKHSGKAILLINVVVRIWSGVITLAATTTPKGAMVGGAHRGLHWADCRDFRPREDWKANLFCGQM